MESTNWNSSSGQDHEGRTIPDWLFAPTNEAIERRFLLATLMTVIE
jgi:hypothetical protein